MKLTKDELRALVSNLNWLKGYTEKQNDKTKSHEVVLASLKLLGEAALRAASE